MIKFFKKRRGIYLSFFLVVFVSVNLINFYGLGFKMDIIEMKVKLNKEFVITMDGYQTAGYVWEPEFDSNFLILKGKIVEPSYPTTIGVGAKEKFVFTAIKTGETDVIMRLKRPWEKVAVEEKRFRIIITE